MQTLITTLRKSTKFFSKRERGFTLIETLVAVLIVATAVIGTMMAVKTALSSYNLSKDQVIAFYLGQEGFEQIRNMRDENLLNGRNWLYGISQTSSDPCYFGKACTVDPTQPVLLISCPTPTTCSLVRRGSAGSYGYNIGWNATTFTRTITLGVISAHEITVTVVVTWPKGSFRARENLYGW